MTALSEANDMYRVGDPHRVPAGAERGGETTMFDPAEVYGIADQLVNGWIGQDGDEMGELIVDPNFDILLNDIDDARQSFPLNLVWQQTCDNCVSLVARGYKALREGMGREVGERVPEFSDVAWSWRVPYARVFKDTVYRSALLLSQAASRMGTVTAVDLNDERDA